MPLLFAQAAVGSCCFCYTFSVLGLAWKLVSHCVLGLALQASSKRGTDVFREGLGRLCVWWKNVGGCLFAKALLWAEERVSAVLGSFRGKVLSADVPKKLPLCVVPV